MSEDTLADMKEFLELLECPDCSDKVFLGHTSVAAGRPWCPDCGVKYEVKEE